MATSSPEGQWTSDDLPGLPDVLGEVTNKDCYDGAAAYRSAALDHLNNHSPKPSRGVETGYALQVDALTRERDALDSQLTRVDMECAEAVTAREAAERTCDELRSLIEGQKEHLSESIEVRNRMRRERDEALARAEAAEARRPAVSRADIEKAILSRRWNTSGPDSQGFDIIHIQSATDAVWSLVSGDDPAVHVVRESDLPEPVKGDDGVWRSGESSYGSRLTPEDLRRGITERLQMVANREAVARAIEAEAAVDSVEELAGQIESTTRAAIRQVCADLADVVPSLDPLALEQVIEVTAVSRKVAAHVLGQEADQ